MVNRGKPSWIKSAGPWSGHGSEVLWYLLTVEFVPLLENTSIKETYHEQPTLKRILLALCLLDGRGQEPYVAKIFAGAVVIQFITSLSFLMHIPMAVSVCSLAVTNSYHCLHLYTECFHIWCFLSLNVLSSIPTLDTSKSRLLCGLYAFFVPGHEHKNMHIARARVQGRINRSVEINTCSSQPDCQFFSSALAPPLELSFWDSFCGVMSKRAGDLAAGDCERRAFTLGTTIYRLFCGL